MSAASVSFRAPMLAWAIAVEDEARFKRILRSIVGVAALACIIFSLMPRPQEDRAKPAELPPRLAKLVLEREPPPMPKKAPEPQRMAKANIPQEPLPAKADPRPAPKQERTKEAPVPEARNPEKNKPPGEIEGARRQAAGVGLLAMKDTLAEMRGAPVAVQLKQDIKPGPGVGTGVGVGVGAGNEPGLPARALITSNLSGGSGGINTASYSRNTGGGGLAGRATTLVEGVAGGGGGGGYGGGGARGGGTGGNGDGAGGSVKKGGSGKASRSIEEIKLVFERNKGAIYALYNRALREEPGLQGKVVVELKISPAGEVVGCRVVSTELKTPELEQKLVARIRQFDFGAKDVDVMVVSWPVDFLPS
ncbi:MAG: AgmX/PglI C-terminal domain-containing protein [Pseudomonadota bacterium]